MKPNIVIFNPDQWRGDVMAHLGHPAAVTPNLDAIVRSDAVSFRHAYCQNPVCTPSRCSFMTGWYPHTRGHRTMRHMLHPERDEPNLLKRLKDEGYFVWWGGKNDLVPGQNGYADHCEVKFEATDDDIERWGRKRMERSVDWRGPADGDRYYGFLAGVIETEEEDSYYDNDWGHVHGAIDFIRNYDGDKPFCVYLPLGYPHPAYQVERQYYDMIDPDTVPPLIPMPEPGEFEPEMRRGVRERMRIAGWPDERFHEVQRLYYAMCTRVEHQFGMLMDALNEQNAYDNTLIFMFADHGDYTGDYRMVEKTQNTFEDCLTRVPFIVKPPRHVECIPGIRDGLVELIDFPATVYDLCDIDPGYSHFGRSLRAVLAGGDDHREAVFCEGGRLVGEEQCTEAANNPELKPSSQYWPRQFAQMDTDGIAHGKAAMCRTRTHKYIRRLYEPDQLFDLTRDPHETRDVANEPAYQETLATLKERMLTWYMKTCDVVPFSIDRRG